jgi:predicted glycosyltransferase
MDVKKRISFLSYAVNGAGVGHVVRQVAIHKWLRRLCSAGNIKSEHWFLTTSEADGLVFREGFAAFKLPSKTIVEAAGIDKLAYLAMAKQWVWTSITVLRPDVLIVDTFAEGSFHELPAVLDVVGTSVLVQRPVKDSFALRPGYLSLLQAYDRVIVPEHEDDVPQLREVMGVQSSRLRFVGPVVRADTFAAFNRTTARQRLGVAPDARCVLVTGGGGGDDTIDALFDAVEAAVGSDERVHLVLAAGPLFRGRPRRGPRRTMFVDHDLAEHAAAFDVAVSAAGFNTIHELLLFGVPLLVVPQEKIADDQGARARRYAERGAVVVTSRHDLGNDLRALLNDEPRRQALSRAARDVMPENHAKDAAIAILQTQLPPSLAAALARLVTDDVVEATVALGAELKDVVELALALAGHRDLAGLESLQVQRAVELCRRTEASPLVLVQLAEQLDKKWHVHDLDAQLVALCGGAISGQHHAVVEFLKACTPERHVDAALLIDALQQAALRLSFSGLGLSQALVGFKTTRPPGPVLVQQAGSVNAARLQVSVNR